MEYFYIIQGFLTSMYCLIAVGVGMLFLNKYRKTYQKQYVALGFTYIFISSGWWGTMVSFISNYFFSVATEPAIRVFLSYVITSFAMITFAYAMLLILYKKHGKIILVLSTILSLGYAISFSYFIIVDYTIVAIVGFPYEVDVNDFFDTYSIIIMLIPVICAFHLAYNSLKSDNIRIRYRGKFLAIAFSLLIFDAVFETYLSDDDLIFTAIGKVLLVISAILFYWSFFLPKRIDNFIATRKLKKSVKKDLESISNEIK